MNAPTKQDIVPYTTKLWGPYVDYCRNVSLRMMAINVETASLLWYECDRVQARTVCDLGSGFTSYVLRRYAADAGYPVTVTSVDDEPEWLDKSAAFIRRHRLSSAGMSTYDDWATYADTFDVIIHDFNSGDTRNRTMWEVAARVNPGGTVIFDDMQNEGHRNEMTEVATAYGWPLVDVHDATTDETHRYAGMVRA